MANKKSFFLLFLFCISICLKFGSCVVGNVDVNVTLEIDQVVVLTSYNEDLVNVSLRFRLNSTSNQTTVGFIESIPYFGSQISNTSELKWIDSVTISNTSRLSRFWNTSLEGPFSFAIWNNDNQTISIQGFVSYNMSAWYGDDSQCHDGFLDWNWNLYVLVILVTFASIVIAFLVVCLMWKPKSQDMSQEQDESNNVNSDSTSPLLHDDRERRV